MDHQSKDSVIDSEIAQLDEPRINGSPRSRSSSREASYSRRSPSVSVEESESFKGNGNAAIKYNGNGINNEESSKVPYDFHSGNREKEYSIQFNRHRGDSFQRDPRHPSRGHYHGYGHDRGNFRERNGPHKTYGKVRIQSPSELRFPEGIEVDKDFVYCIIRNVHKLDILFAKLGLLEYVDIPSLVRACNLSPEKADKVYSLVEENCYSTCVNPSSFLMHMASSALNNKPERTSERGGDRKHEGDNNQFQEEHIRERSRSRDNHRYSEYRYFDRHHSGDRHHGYDRYSNDFNNHHDRHQNFDRHDYDHYPHDYDHYSRGYDRRSDYERYPPRYDRRSDYERYPPRFERRSRSPVRRSHSPAYK